MQIFYSNKHRLHAPPNELHGGAFVQPFEMPSRMDVILERLKERGFDEIADPGPVDLTPLSQIHAPSYLRFLETVWEDWKAEGMQAEVIATNIPARGMHLDRPPRNIDGKVGYFCHSSETAMTAGTYEAACASLASAQAAQSHVLAGAPGAFALCRPPGHHATRDQFGGYCFLNNAAAAAQMLRNGGVARVAVLDIDFHHGNGTQDIFYDRGDVFFASLHGAPEDSYPYYIGHADEAGRGAGEGSNLNLPMPPGTGYSAWSEALDHAVANILAWQAEALVVSLGVDAFKEDPISFFRLDSDDFTDAGRRIGQMGLPTVFVMEGGYAVDEIGINTVNVLEGFADHDC
ncbi:MAG: histone deacetylase family protein [Pseudomonadota bacterium]